VGAPGGYVLEGSGVSRARRCVAPRSGLPCRPERALPRGAAADASLLQAGPAGSHLCEGGDRTGPEGCVRARGTRTRCSPENSSSATRGGTTTTPARPSSTSTSAPCAEARPRTDRDQARRRLPAAHRGPPAESRDSSAVKSKPGTQATATAPSPVESEESDAEHRRQIRDRTRNGCGDWPLPACVTGAERRYMTRRHLCASSLPPLRGAPRRRRPPRPRPWRTPPSPSPPSPGPAPPATGR
jgi:hypothetical protein